MQILVISPNKQIGLPIVRMLKQHGIAATLSNEPAHSHFLAMTLTYKALVFVEAIGDKNELPLLLHRLRAEGCTSPVIWLTKNQSTSRASRLMEGGSLSYHILPHSYTALLSELFECNSRSRTDAALALYKTKRFEVNPLNRSILFDAELLSFTPREYAIMELFIRKHGQIISKAQLWDDIWGDHDYPVNNTIEVHVRRIRVKLVEKLILTVPGIGYRLHPNC